MSPFFSRGRSRGLHPVDKRVNCRLGRGPVGETAVVASAVEELFAEHGRVRFGLAAPGRSVGTEYVDAPWRASPTSEPSQWQHGQVLSYVRPFECSLDRPRVRMVLVRSDP